MERTSCAGNCASPAALLPEDAILVVNAYRAGTEIVNGRSRQIDAGGRFVIEGLPTGEYDLKLSAFFPSGSTPETGKLTERLNKQSRAVTVGANQAQVIRH